MGKNIHIELLSACCNPENLTLRCYSSTLPSYQNVKDAAISVRLMILRHRQYSGHVALVLDHA